MKVECSLWLYVMLIFICRNLVRNESSMTIIHPALYLMFFTKYKFLTFISVKWCQRVNTCKKGLTCQRHIAMTLRIILTDIRMTNEPKDFFTSYKWILPPKDSRKLRNHWKKYSLNCWLLNIIVVHTNDYANITILVLICFFLILWLFTPLLYDMRYRIRLNYYTKLFKTFWKSS